MESRTTTARRRALRRLAALSAVLAVLAVFTVGSGPSSASTAQSGGGILPEGDWPEPAMTWATDFIRRAEQELPARYSDPNQLPAGFVDIGPIVRGGYRHFVNVSWFSDPHILNPAYPESVIYRRTSTGGWQVEAAMFFLWPSARMETIPELIRWVPGWHTHPELCSNDRGQVVGTPIGGGCPPNSAPVETPMMHAWIVDNECGHRFGGLDGGGLHCDYGHEHDA